MDYIVNPSWFYWLNTIEAFRYIFFALLTCLVITSIVILVVLAIAFFEGKDFKDRLDEDGNPTDSDWKTYLITKRLAKIILPITIILAIIIAFIPSKETIISMMIAKYATKTNVNMTIEGIKSIVDYIINAMKEIKG